MRNNGSMSAMKNELRTLRLSETSTRDNSNYRKSQSTPRCKPGCMRILRTDQSINETRNEPEFTRVKLKGNLTKLSLRRTLGRNRIRPELIVLGCEWLHNLFLKLFNDVVILLTFLRFFCFEHCSFVYIHETFSVSVILTMVRWSSDVLDCPLSAESS